MPGQESIGSSSLTENPVLLPRIGVAFEVFHWVCCMMLERGRNERPCRYPDWQQISHRIP